MIYRTQPRAEYDATQAVNWSTLKALAKSPAAYDHALSRTRSDSATFRVGRLCHMAVLEPDRFAVDVAVFYGKVRSGKAWDEFQAENSGVSEIVSETEMNTAVAVASAVAHHPTASELLRAGLSEVSLTGEIHGAACKGRLDHIGPASLVADLKTTQNCHPRQFAMSAYRYLYHGQAAFYDLLARANGLEPSGAAFIAVETVAPYEVTVYRVSDDVMELGRSLVRDLLEKRAQCLAESNYGPEYPGAVELTYPSWVYGSEGDALEGVE